jgi:hypothetical protein
MYNIYLSVYTILLKNYYTYKVNLLQTYSLYMCLQILCTTVQSCAHMAHSEPKCDKKRLFKKIFLSRTKRDKEELIIVLGG